MTARAYDAATANCLGTGVWVQSAHLSYPTPIEISSFGDWDRKYLASPGPATLGLTLAADQDGMERIYALLSERLLSDRSIGHQGLGSGHVCQFCNTTYATGVLQCPQCGGATELRQRVLPMRTTGILTRWDFDMPLASYARVSLSIDFNDPLTFTGRWEDLIRYSLLTRPDHWLCPFCGLFVDASCHTCPGCGGNRLPVKELAGLERVCIYCGKVTRGGYCCPRCNGRLKPSLAYFGRKI